MPDSLTEKELKAIYSDHVLGIFLLDKYRNIKSMNKKAMELLGYEKEEVKGENIKDFYESNQDYHRVGKLYDKELKKGKEIKEEVRLIRKNGDKIWVEIIGKKIDDNYRWFIKDIDVQKKQEIEIRKKHRELEKLKNKIDLLNHEKRDFISNISHELRTPLNAIIGFSDILKDDETDEERLEKLDMIKESGLKLLMLIDKIVNNITIDISDNKKEEIKIKDIINSFYEIYKTKLKDSNLNYKIKIDKTMPNILMGNQGKIEHIILNLIKKTTKLISRGDIEISFKYEKVLIIFIKIKSNKDIKLKDIEFPMIGQLLRHINGRCTKWEKNNIKNIKIEVPLEKKNKKTISVFKIKSDDFKNVNITDLKEIKRKLEENCRVFSKEQVIKLGKEVKKVSGNINFIGEEIIDSGREYNIKKLKKILDKITEYLRIGGENGGE